MFSFFWWRVARVFSDLNMRWVVGVLFGIINHLRNLPLCSQFPVVLWVQEDTSIFDWIQVNKCGFIQAVLCLLEETSDGRNKNCFLSANMNQNLNDLYCFFFNIVIGCILKRPLYDLLSREELVIYLRISFFHFLICLVLKF